MRQVSIRWCFFRGERVVVAVAKNASCGLVFFIGRKEEGRGECERGRSKLLQ